MEEQNILDIRTRNKFRTWLETHHATEKACWVCVKRGRPTDDDTFWYLDAVEEALCFGWIDSRQKPINGVLMQCFTPRKRNSPWSELNKERARRLEKLGRMTDALKAARAWTKFKSFPSLYQRIRAYNVAFYKKRDPLMYQQALTHLIEETKKGRMFGEWNDYGRLLDY